MPEETHKKISEAARSRPGRESRFWITDGVNNKRVTEDELESFLNNGWKRGHQNFRK